MDELKTYVFELKATLDLLIKGVAGREGVAEDLCKAAQAACSGAAKRLQKKTRYKPEKQMELLEKTLRLLSVTFFLLESTPEINESKDVSIQEKYEACMYLLARIDNFAVSRRSGFEAMGVHFAHPLVEDMHNTLEQTAKLLEITHDNILIETDETDQIKHALGESFIKIEKIIDKLYGFFDNDNAADALKIKQALVNELAEELEIFQPKNIGRMVQVLENTTFGEGAVQTLVEVAKEMSEVRDILVKHASNDEKEKLKAEFNYKDILAKQEAPEPMALLRHGMMVVSAKMVDAVKHNPNPHITNEWIQAARGIEEVAANYRSWDDEKKQWIEKSPKAILPFVNIALDTMTNEETRLFRGEPPLLKQLRDIHDRLDRAARKEK